MASNGYIESPSTKAWKRVGLAVAQRRQELGLSHRQAAHEANSGSATWSVLENGKVPGNRIQRITASKIEKVLRWAPGSFEACLKQGEEPRLWEEKPNLEYIAVMLKLISEKVDDLDSRLRYMEETVSHLQRLEQALKAL